MNYTTPASCPVCSEKLEITRLTCPACSTEVSGKFQPCRYCGLGDKMKVFLETFLKSRGNIKEVEKRLSLSYPTVKGLLDELLRKLYPEEADREDRSAGEILDMLEEGQISAEEAAALLSGKGGGSAPEKGRENHE